MCEIIVLSDYNVQKNINDKTKLAANAILVNLID